VAFTRPTRRLRIRLTSQIRTHCGGAVMRESAARAAGAAQQILAPTRSLPETMDIPRPFTAVLPDRIDGIVFACEQTGPVRRGSDGAHSRCRRSRRAPSRVLTAARHVADPAPQKRKCRQGDDGPDGPHEPSLPVRLVRSTRASMSS
jgi:hypothetical protein